MPREQVQNRRSRSNTTTRFLFQLLAVIGPVGANAGTKLRNGQRLWMPRRRWYEPYSPPSSTLPVRLGHFGAGDPQASRRNGSPLLTHFFFRPEPGRREGHWRATPGPLPAGPSTPRGVRRIGGIVSPGWRTRHAPRPNMSQSSDLSPGLRVLRSLGRGAPSDLPRPDLATGQAQPLANGGTTSALSTAARHAKPSRRRRRAPGLNERRRAGSASSCSSRCRDAPVHGTGLRARRTPDAAS